MRPVGRPEPVARPRVEDRLRAGIDRGPVLLCAPAGWGKTAALTAALRRPPGPVVWHACTRRDEDPGRLLLGILRELRRVVPGAADVLLEQLGAPGHAVDPPDVAGALLDELRGLLVDPLVLVLDDAERLGDDPVSLEVLEVLLDADPGVLRLALAARHRPAVRLARREAAGSVVVLGQDDLRFDPQECGALLLGRDGVEPDPDAVGEALARTGGWPLGLVLGRREASARAAGIEAFVTEELLDGLATEERALVLDASVDDVLRPGTGALRDAPSALLERLALRGLTAAATGPDPGPGSGSGAPDPAGALRWHPLVQEALLARWRAERPAEARAAVLAASAEELEAAGRPADAVERWLEAGRPAEALSAMLAAAPGTLRAAPGTVRRWVSALPRQARDTADGRWLAGRLAATDGRMREAAAAYVEALADLDGERRDVALMGVMECTYFVGDLSIADPVLGILETPEALGDRPVALLACAWLGINRAAHGDVDAGVALAERAFAQPAGDYARAFELLLRTYVDLPAGRHAALRRRLEEVEARPDAPEFPEWMASIRGFLEADVGDWEEAVAQARRMVERADRDDGTRYWQTLGAVQHAWSLAVAGHWADAATALEPLRATRMEGWPRSWVDAGLAMVGDAAGDRAAARDHAERALRASEGAPPFIRHLLVVGVAPVLARAGEEPAARRLVEATLARVDERFAPGRADHARARLRAVRGWLRERAGDADDAVTDLRAAVAAGPDVVRPAWALVGPVVRAALAHGELDPEEVAGVVDRAFRGGPELLALAEHPAPDVRRAVAPAVAASGHPSAPARLKALRADPDPGVAARAAGAAPRAVRDAPPLRIRTLGGFEVRRGPWPVEERAWGRPTAPRLVRFLLVHRGEPVPQDLILEALWPDRPPEAAKGQLQVAVSRARQVLDPPGTGAAESALVLQGGAYRFVPRAGDRVDSEAFLSAAAAALAAPQDGRRAALAVAAGLWTGDPLPEERYAGWADAWAEGLRSTLHRVLRELAREERAAGDEAAVAETARRMLALDPVDEGAHRTLMEAYARTGRPAFALRQFLVCRHALVETLGIEPGEETVRLQAAVLAGRTGPG